MRIGVANTLKNRSASTSKDAKMQNCFAEQKGGVLRSVKRPSTIATFEALQGGAGNGLGLFSFSTPDGDETLVGIQNDVLNNSPTPIATRLAFTTQPVDWKIATAMSPSIVVTARNSFGGTMTGYTGDVTLSFQENPNGGTLSGTLTVAAIAGVATFSNVKIDKVGGGYSLLASGTQIFGAGRARVSSAFKIVSNLRFTTQPVNTAPNSALATVVVTVVDSSNNAITGYVGNVSVAMENTAGSSGVLAGTTTVAAVGGVATFSALSTIDAEGAGYTLVSSETAGGLADVTSNSFNIQTSHSLISAANVAGAGSFGFQDGIGGSITPTTLNGATILTLYNEATGTLDFTVQGVVAQSFFTSITINGTTKTSSSASFSAVGNSNWRWLSTPLITGTGTYPVNIV